MLLELMSNGKLAQLPPENIPDGISIPEKSSVMLLLPHNKYLLGTDSGKWLYGAFNSEISEEQPTDVFLYEDEDISLINEGARPTVIPADTVNILRRELFSLREPPGNHKTTVLMLKTIMREHSVFNDEKFLDEKYFSSFAKRDLILYKAYWTLRFSLARDELETTTRLKKWLAADPKIFSEPKNFMKIYFSILDLPDEDALNELIELKFSNLELYHLGQQQASPLVVYNPMSGWLLIGQFGRKRTMFKVWIYLSHDLYHELKYQKKLSIRDIMSVVWGEHETRQAMLERAKYKGDEEFYL